MDQRDKTYIAATFAALFLTTSDARAQYGIPLDRDECLAASECAITNFVGHDSKGTYVDYTCGTRTYCRPGYCHQGTDFVIGWSSRPRKLDAANKPVADSKGNPVYLPCHEHPDECTWDSVHVRAAAAGVVVAAAPGDCYDECDTSEYNKLKDGACYCATNTDDGPAGGRGNFVKIRDIFGRAVTYMHMKRDSVLVKTGDLVTCGQALGLIGSSGYSTAPHVHYETRDSTSNSNTVVVRDPFAGPCDDDVSYWMGEPTYPQFPANRCYTFADGTECTAQPGADTGSDRANRPGLDTSQHS